MTDLSHDLLKDLKKVLKELFNIEFSVEGESKTFSFKDLYDDSKFSLNREPLVWYPELFCRAEDKEYSSPNGTQLRIMDASFKHSSAGDFSVFILNGMWLWKLSGNNYQRDVPVPNHMSDNDTPHIVLSYMGFFPERFNIRYIDTNEKGIISASVDIPSYDAIKKNNYDDKDIIASFNLDPDRQIIVTFNGLFLKRQNANGFTYDLISQSYSPEIIKDFIENHLVSFAELEMIDKDVLDKMKKFLVTRVDELSAYIAKHIHEYNQRLDDMVKAKASIRDNTVNEAVRMIHDAISQYDTDAANITDKRKRFLYGYKKES